MKVELAGDNSDAAAEEDIFVRVYGPQWCAEKQIWVSLKAILMPLRMYTALLRILHYLLRLDWDVADNWGYSDTLAEKDNSLPGSRLYGLNLIDQLSNKAVQLTPRISVTAVENWTRKLGLSSGCFSSRTPTCLPLSNCHLWPCHSLRTEEELKIQISNSNFSTLLFTSPSDLYL